MLYFVPWIEIHLTCITIGIMGLNELNSGLDPDNSAQALCCIEPTYFI